MRDLRLKLLFFVFAFHRGDFVAIAFVQTYRDVLGITYRIVYE